MDKKGLKGIKLVFTFLIVLLFVWFLIIHPMISFHKNEMKLTDAAKRYYELNSNRLPTGERVGVVSLKTLVDGAYIKDDLKAPYFGKICSLENSWVKTIQKNGEYKYYTYLDCGVLKSAIDHKGPTIKLVGEQNITIGYEEKFEDPGIKSVVDNNDGKIDLKNVIVKNNVDTSKVGSYEITYTAYDSLNNKNTVVRIVNVVKILKDTIKKELNKGTYYKGMNPNNYIYFANDLFRILKIDGDNVVIVADSDVSYVDFDSIDSWFKYYDKYVPDDYKKIIVKNKYCNMSVNQKNINTTKCTNYTKNRLYGLLSISDINNTFDDGSYLFGDAISWTLNTSGSNAYAFKYYFNDSSYYYEFEKKHNFGIRPVMTIKGDSLIMDGNGTFDNPYKLNIINKIEKNSKLNERQVGEYFNYSNYLWRIQNIESDGSVKAILQSSLADDNGYVKLYYSDSVKDEVYNPTEKGNVGYIINNVSSKYFDTSYLIKHTIEVPIYSGEPKYKKEIDIKKYEVKISSPNMFEIYSAYPKNSGIGSYWLLNSSKSNKENPGVSETGSVMYGDGSLYYSYGIRPVVYFNKNVSIVSGKGTLNNPFNIKK